MNGLTAEETLRYMIKLLTQALEEIGNDKEEQTDFIYGEKTAYVECLEWLQRWKKAKENGLNYAIESRFFL